MLPHEQVGMWPVAYGGLQNYFVILAGYLLAAFVGNYAVLRCKTRRVAN